MAPAWALLLFLTPGWQPAGDQAREAARRGYELLRQGKLDAAESELRQAVKLAPREPLALAVLGMVLVQRSQLEEGAKYLERALAIDASDTGTRYNLAVALARLGRRAQAREHLERILRQEPGHPQAKSLLAALEAGDDGYETAREHYRAGRYQESQAVLERMIASGTTEARVFGLLAWCHHRQGRPEAALEAIHRAIAAERSGGPWYAQGAQILLENRDYQAAYRMALQALALDPGAAAALKLRGRIELENGGPRQAFEAFAKAAEVDPADPEARLWLGIAQKALRQYQEAEVTFERGLAQFPDFAALYAAYAELLLEPELRARPGSQTRARALLEKALALDGTLAEARYLLGKFLLEEGKADEALPHLQEAARRDPGAARLRFALAEAYRILGQRERQREQLEIFRKLLSSSSGLR